MSGVDAPLLPRPRALKAEVRKLTGAAHDGDLLGGVGQSWGRRGACQGRPRILRVPSTGWQIPTLDMDCQPQTQVSSYPGSLHNCKSRVYLVWVRC